MASGGEQSTAQDAAALFQQWLESFGATGHEAPWDAVRIFGEALRASAAGAGTATGEPPTLLQALRALVRDFRARLECLVDLPSPPGSAPSLATFPMLGPAREWQLMLDSLWKSWVEERAASAALQRADWRVLATGLAMFEQSLASSSALPESLLELHAHLVDCCEAAHQQALREDAYLKAFGAHANAAMALHEALAALGEKSMPLIGLPRPSELRALESRLAALEARHEAPVAQAKEPAARGRARPPRGKD